MYLDYFGFREKPFDVTPDPRFLYMSQSHREALASLLYGIKERKGFISIIGDAGTGKTTLLNAAMAQLDSSVRVAYVYGPEGVLGQILQVALVELGAANPDESLTEVQAFYRLSRYVVEQFSSGGNVVLMVDEAQTLNARALESLRLLSNLETQKHKLIQIVLSGQPKLDTTLGQADLRQLLQRIGIRRVLTPFGQDDTYEYIKHRLNSAHYKGPSLIDERAKKTIWRYSQGIPRKINILCDNSLLTAYGMDRKKIKADIIQEVIRDLQWSPDLQPSEAIAAMTDREGAKRPKPWHFFTPSFAFARSMVLVLCLVAFLALVSVNSGTQKSDRKTDGGVHNSGLVKVPIAARDLLEPDSSISNEKIPEAPAMVSAGPMTAYASELESRSEERTYPYSLQLADFHTREDAQWAVNDLMASHLSPYMVPPDIREGGGRWRVYLGYFESQDKAREERDDRNLHDATIARTPYANLIGVYPTDKEVMEVILRLNRVGYAGYSIKDATGASRVMVGAFATQQEAQEVLLALRDLDIASRIVRR